MSGRWLPSWLARLLGLSGSAKRHSTPPPPQPSPPSPISDSLVSNSTSSTDPLESPAPDWASPLDTHAKFEAFERLVLADLRARMIGVQYEDGVIVPQAPGLKGHQWGLSNLAQLCSRAPEESWPALIARHFDIMIRVGEQEAKVDAELREYAKARLQLVPRLWDELTISEVRQHAVFREDIPGLLTVLSIDLPESIRTVSREMLDLWGVGEDQAFARAFDNLDSMTERKITPLELGDGQRLLSVEGGSYYNASLALKLDTMPELVGRHGAFIGMPTRHRLLSLPFDGPGTMEKLQFLLFETRLSEQQGPGSLSHRVYWYFQGRWHEVAFEISTSRINVMQPRALTEYLETLDSDHD